MLEKGFCKAIRFVGMILTGYLFVQGLFTLCVTRRVSEKTDFVKNTPLFGLAGVVFFFLLGYCLHRRKAKFFLQTYGHILFWSLLVIMTSFLTWWILKTQFWYYSDMEKIYMCAEGLLAGNYWHWQPGGYAFMMPHQNGMILTAAMFLYLFGIQKSFLAFYLLSILGWALSVISIRGALLLLVQDKALVNAQCILAALYLPYAFLVTYLYGDSIGYGFAMLGIYLGVRYHKTGRMRTLAAAGGAMALALFFKQNCTIILTGLFLLLVYDALTQRTCRGAYGKYGMLAVFLMIALLGNFLPGKILAQVTGNPPSAGNTKLAWVAMGLQESKKAPGWWNGYNDWVFEKNHFDTTQTALEAKEQIGASLHNFMEHPVYAWRFFHHKLASEWNNPTFECFQIQNARKTGLELSSLVKSVLNDGGKGNMLLLFGLDICQSAFYFGIFLFFLLSDKKDLWQYLFGLLFLGAFLFWTFWEAKAVYVLPYFFLLLPYAVQGIALCLSPQKRKKAVAGIASLGVIVFGVFIADTPIVTESLKLNEDTQNYYEYIHQYNDNFNYLRY